MERGGCQGTDEQRNWVFLQGLSGLSVEFVHVHVMTYTNFASCFSEVLPALSYFLSRQVRSAAWKAQLEIGPSLKIPVCLFTRVYDFTSDFQSFLLYIGTSHLQPVVCENSFMLNSI